MNRLTNVDAAKFIALLAIICIHTTPFKPEILGKNGTDIYLIINQLSRFAVPLFFIFTGYFWGQKVIDSTYSWLHSFSIFRIAITVWLGWCLIYLLPYNLGSVPDYGMTGPLLFWKSNVSQFLIDPWNILEGTKVHLWFLMSMATGITICGAFAHFRAFKLLTLIAIAIYVIGVFASGYKSTEFGISLPFNTRNGPFISTLMLISGYWLSRLKPSPSIMVLGLLCFGFGVWLHYTEALWLWKNYQTWLLHDYLFGTYVTALGISLFVISAPSIRKFKFVSWVSQHSLGIYAVHFIYVDNLFFIDTKIQHPLWEVGYVLIVFLLSVLTSYCLSKSRLTLWLVASRNSKS